MFVEAIFVCIMPDKIILYYVHVYLSHDVASGSDITPCNKN